jgi:hypothetical protein
MRSDDERLRDENERLKAELTAVTSLFIAHLSGAIDSKKAAEKLLKIVDEKVKIKVTKIVSVA